MQIKRLGRKSFWMLSITAWVVFFIVREALAMERMPFLATAWAAVGLAVLSWLCAARLHDRGRSAWWLLAFMVPVMGALWLVWELACRRGQLHANAFGPAPDHH